jgi:SAM-dependent methyltransferase
LADNSTPLRERKSAAWWDEFWGRPLAATGRALTCRRTAEEALRLLAPELDRLASGRPARVLDLGCGHGDLTPLLLEDPRLEIVGLDLSAAALDRFQTRLGRRLPARLGLTQASVYELPFQDGAFDVVVSFGYASAASYTGAEWQVARVLRPDGVALVDFANPSLYHWLAAPGPTIRWLQRYRDPTQAQYHFGRRGLRRHFEPTGLRLDAVRYLNAYPPLERLAGRPWSAALDRRLSSLFGPALGRVLLVRLRRTSMQVANVDAGALTSGP